MGTRSEPKGRVAGQRLSLKPDELFGNQARPPEVGLFFYP
jgi:hypothetical protein